MKRRFLMVTVCLMMILSTLAAPISASAASDVMRVMKISVHGARLRSGPGDYPWKYILKQGTKVVVGKKTNAFYEVRTSDGKTGYVFRDFLSDYGAISTKQLFTIKKSGKLFSKPSKKSKRVTKVKAGQSVFVYRMSNSWAYVKTMSGKGGYVPVSLLSKV